jgi:hypothetical protein
MQASLSWRLLHRFFLEDNGPKLQPFFSALPANAADLTLGLALDVIVLAMGCPEQLSIFLGVDEYQAIPSGPQILDKSQLQQLLEMLTTACINKEKPYRLYTMMAGSHWAEIEDIAGS